MFLAEPVNSLSGITTRPVGPNGPFRGDKTAGGAADHSTPSSLVLKNRGCHKKNSGALVRQRTISTERPPLVGEVSAWFSSQSSRLQIQTSRVRFPALPDFPRSSGSGTGSTQPREDN
jgi:hypothetical protein